MRILTVYASAHGSTAEIARFLAEVWRERGIESTLAAAGPAVPLVGYDAYVLGSAVHHGLWLPEMASFVRHAREDLARKPVYLWLTCLRAIEPDGYAYVTNNYLPNLLSRALSFRKIGIFAGKVNPATLSADENWTLTFRYDGATAPALLAGDHRDWDAIRTWASAVADDLSNVSEPGPTHS